jgi:hypothetical protein
LAAVLQALSSIDRAISRLIITREKDFLFISVHTPFLSYQQVN